MLAIDLCRASSLAFQFRQRECEGAPRINWIMPIKTRFKTYYQNFLHLGVACNLSGQFRTLPPSPLPPLPPPPFPLSAPLNSPDAHASGPWPFPKDRHLPARCARRCRTLGFGTPLRRPSVGAELSKGCADVDAVLRGVVCKVWGPRPAG